jgi:hypothetical protein
MGESRRHEKFATTTTLFLRQVLFQKPLMTGTSRFSGNRILRHDDTPAGGGGRDHAANRQRPSGPAGLPRVDRSRKAGQPPVSWPRQPKNARMIARVMLIAGAV